MVEGHLSVLHVFIHVMYVDQMLSAVLLVSDRDIKLVFLHV